MKNYYKPLIKEETIEVSDIVANSNNNDRYHATLGTWIISIIFMIMLIVILLLAAFC